MEESFDKEMKRIFFGSIPEPFEGMDFSPIVPKFIEALNKQSAKSAKDLNYVQLIQDLGEAFTSHINKIAESKGSLEIAEVQQYLRHNRAILLSQYLKIIQDKEESMFVKAEVIVFYRNLLITFQEIYSIPLIWEQEAFFARLDYDAKQQQDLIDEFHAIMKAIHEPEPEICSWFKGDRKQLMELANKLADAKFISSPAIFMQSFAIPCNSVCDWNGSIRSFMYLIREISIVGSLLEPVLVHLCNHFTIKQERKEPKNLRQTLLNIGGNIAPNEFDQLRGSDYQKLYKICRSIFTA